VTLDLPIAGLQGTWLDGARLALDADISRSDPDLSESGQPEDLTVTADQTDLRAGIVVPLIRSRSRNLFARAGFTWRGATSVTDFAGIDSSETDRLAILDAQITFDAADRFGGVSLVDATIRQGLDAFGAEVGAVGPAAGDPAFTLVAGTLSRLQRIGQSSWSVYGEAIGQYAAEILPDSERFALGNSTIGRGYAPGNTTGDSGYGGRLEVRRTVADDQGGAEFYAFGDYGQAYDRSGERDGEQWQTLASYGVGARIDVTPWLTVTPEIAQQADGVPTDTTDPDLETRFFLGAVARF
jgi:hemolysin activation/secretion protein